MRTTHLPVALLALACTGCMGDDAEQKRAEAADWCRITLQMEDTFDHRNSFGPGTNQITWDRAAEWVDVAPADIRPSTKRAALILRELPTDPPKPGLAPARVEIAEYVERYCDEPTPCIGDVKGNPAFPCLH